jgi:hypothetical protein
MRHHTEKRGVAMWIQRLTMIVLMIVGTVPMASASDELYRCSDGTFTNRVELQCPTYESKGIVRMQARTAVPSNGTVKSDEPKTPSADVKLFKE